MLEENELFKALPGCYLLLSPTRDFIILQATDNYLRVTGTSTNIIGQRIFDIFPDNPEDPAANGVQNLTASLLEVMQTKKSHRMAVQRYDTRVPGSDRFVVRYWRPLNIPVTDKDGNLTGIIHSVEDVNDNVLLQQHLKMRDKKMQQQITDAISTTQEIERMEISRELHDNINQILLTSRLFLGRALEKEQPDKNLIRSGYELLEKAIGEIKNISQALLQTTAEEENMMEAIENLLQQVMFSGSINVHKKIELPDESLIEAKVKVAIFRIVQEQLSNVLKHAEAKNLYIDIDFSGGVLNLIIRDDGKGFHVAEKKPGLGFQNMKSRVAVMDGNININSKPGDGCTIQVNIPVAGIAVAKESVGQR